MNLKEEKLFTWMSSVRDSSSTSRTRQGNCQRRRRSAWTTTALSLQAFLQHDNTRQFLSAHQWPEPLRLCGSVTSAETKIFFHVFKITHSHVTVRAGCNPQPYLPPAPRLGSVGQQCGPGKGSSHFSVQAQPDQNGGGAKIRSLDFCFSDSEQAFGPRTPQFWVFGSHKMCTEYPFINNIEQIMIPNLEQRWDAAVTWQNWDNQDHRATLSVCVSRGQGRRRQCSPNIAVTHQRVSRLTALTHKCH